MARWAVAAAALAVCAADLTWTQASPSGPGPSARFGASVAPWRDDNILCGGTSFFGEPVSDCFVLSSNADGTWMWSQAVPAGKIAALSRSLAVSTVAGSYALVYGGNTTAVGPVATQPVVIEIGPWTQVTPASFPGDVPVARYGHCAVVTPDGSSLVVFGGAALDDGADLSDVATLALNGGQSTSFTWSAPTTRGTGPSARRFHSCALYGNSMIVYGGLTGTTANDDVFLLSVAGSDQWLWQEQTTVNSHPLYNHRAVVYGNQMLVLMGLTTNSGPSPSQPTGGVLTLDFDTWNWRLPQVDGTSPTGWSLPTVGLVDATGNGDMVIAVFGGAYDDQGGALTNELNVLSGFTPPPPPPKSKLVPILAGVIAGTFILCVVIFLAWWQRRRFCREAAHDMAYIPIDASAGGFDRMHSPGRGGYGSVPDRQRSKIAGPALSAAKRSQSISYEFSDAHDDGSVHGDDDEDTRLRFH